MEFSPRFKSLIVAALTSDHSNEGVETRTELDSHADSPCVGRNAKIIEHTGKRVNVSGFTDSLGKRKSIPVVHAAVAYDDEYTGKTYILIIYNALYFEEMECNLLPPFMCRLAGVEINECPKILSKNPTEENHSIYFPKIDFRIPMQLFGIISYIPTRAPTSGEWNNNVRMNLTPASNEWDPHDDTYANQEHGMLDYNGKIRNKRRKMCIVDDGGTGDDQLDFAIANVSIDPNKAIENPWDWTFTTSADHSAVGAVMTEICKGLCSKEFLSGLENANHDISAVKTGKRMPSLHASELARKWNISPELAQKTLDCTTQEVARSADEPSLTRRYKSNDRMLRYNR